MKIGDGAKIGSSKTISTDQVGIQDQLTVTVVDHCEWEDACIYAVRDDLRYVRHKTLHDAEHVLVLNDDGTETDHHISLYINWDGEYRLSSRETGKSLDLKKIRRACPGCGRTVHSWREEDRHVRVAEDDLQEGDT